MSVLKIIPHSNVRNNETRRLQSALYDLFLPEKENPILAQAKRLTGKSRESAYLWWIVRMTAKTEGEGEQAKTVKQIEFFAMMPETYIDAYKTKFRGHEGWKSSTLETVDQFEPIHDMKQTDLYRLKLKRHDMFSLEGNYTEQETPIREALAVIDEMKAGENLTLFMRMEPVDRVKWKRTADYAWEQWQKGDMLYRAGFDPLRIAGKAYELGDNLFHRSHNAVSDVLGALQRQVSPPGASDFQHKEPPKKMNHEREALLVNGDLSPRTKAKRNAPVFKTVIRFIVTSPDKVRREMLARSFTSAYESPDKQSKWKDNILEMKKIRSKKELENLQQFEINDLDPNLLSVDEIGKLQQLPTKKLQEEYREMLQANHRIEIEIPKVFLDDTGILCGTATDRGMTHNIYIPTTSKDFLFTPRVFNGSPRMGKDQAVINLIVEAKRKHGIGAIIPDFIDERNRTADGNHWRGMANGVRDALNPEDIMDFDMSNTFYSLYLGLQSAFQNLSDPRIQGDVIAEYLSDFLLSEGDGDKFQTQEYVREAGKITAGDLIGMKQMFIDQQYRRAKIKEFEDVFDTFVWEDYDSMTDKDGHMSSAQAAKAAPILRRIGQIEGREYLKPMFCQTLNPKFKLAKWIEEGKVINLRVRMPKGIAMPEPVKQILGYWIMLITFIIKLSLDGRGAGTLMVFNEPHQYISKGLIHFMERMLSEGPKYRFTPVIAFHNFSQFKNHRSFVDMLKSSNPNWHLFKNSNQDVYKELMPILSKTFETEQQAFEATKEFQYIACFMNGGEYEPPFVCDALPMVNDRYKEQDNSKLTEEHIKLYGRPTQEVLREIKERRRKQEPTKK